MKNLLTHLKKIVNNYIFVIILVSLILTAGLIFIYFQYNSTKLTGLVSFISGFSTLGLLILTTFYVIFTNKQIKELQKQRLQNIQPLPNIEIVEAAITSPKVVFSDNIKGIELIVDLHIRYKLKNVGNGTAILVDTIFNASGKEIKIKPETFHSNRIMILENGNEETKIFGLRDEKYEIVKAFNKELPKGCPASRFNDVVINYSSLYKNILGTPFLVNLDFSVSFPKTEQEVFSKWLALINSYSKQFSNDIETYIASRTRNSEQGHKYFDELESKIYIQCPKKVIPLKLHPISRTLKVSPLDSKRAEVYLKKIHLGVPIPHIDPNHKETQQFQEFEKDIMKKYFK